MCCLNVNSQLICRDGKALQEKAAKKAAQAAGGSGGDAGGKKSTK